MGNSEFWEREREREKERECGVISSWFNHIIILAYKRRECGWNIWASSDINVFLWLSIIISIVYKNVFHLCICLFTSLQVWPCWGGAVANKKYWDQCWNCKLCSALGFWVSFLYSGLLHTNGHYKKFLYLLMHLCCSIIIIVCWTEQTGWLYQYCTTSSG